MAIRTQRGIISKDGTVIAMCFVELDSDGAYHLKDSDVSPALLDGDYHLAAFGRSFNVTRRNGDWNGLEIIP
jgi:hypothetical protein